MTFQMHCSLVLKRSGDLRSHRKGCIWLSGVLIKDFLDIFCYRLIFYYYVLAITNYFITTVCNFSRVVLTKHNLKNIRGESVFLQL